MYTLPLKVRDYEVDAEGIVNNAIYLHYFEHTRHEYCASRGFTFARMRELGMSPVAREIHVRYLVPLGLGQSFTSHLDIRRQGARFIFHQWIENEEGKLCADAEVTIVNVINGQPTRGDELETLL